MISINDLTIMLALKGIKSKLDGGKRTATTYLALACNNIINTNCEKDNKS